MKYAQLREFDTTNGPGVRVSLFVSGCNLHCKVGDHVEAGQTLGIIEAMKLLNEIEAETSGTIKEICVENAQPVEFGQPLFIIG